MGDVARGKDFVEGSIAGVESVVVLIAAVEIDFQSRQIGGARESERAIAVPKHRVRGAAEHAAEKSRARRIRSASKVHRQFLDQRGAVRAHRNEKLRMAESEVQRTVAAHGNSGDGAMPAAGCDAIAFFDEWKKFLQKEILITRFAILRIDVKTGIAARCGNQKFPDLAPFPHVFGQIPGAGVDEGLFVVAQAVQEVENGEVPGRILVERRRKDDAIRNRVTENFARDPIALNAARSGAREWRRGQEKEPKDGESRRPIHSATRRWD